MPETMPIRLLLAIALPLSIIGCKRAETAPAPRADPAAVPNSSSLRELSSAGPGPLAQPPAPAVITNTDDLTAVLGQLSTELRKYVVATRTAPRSFEDFVAKSRVQAPPPPAGKKYAIQSGSVILVNR